MTRPALQRIAELIDIEWPSAGWRIPADEEHQQDDRLEQAAERVQRNVRRGLDDIVATTNSIGIGLDALARDAQP